MAIPLLATVASVDDIVVAGRDRDRVAQRLAELGISAQIAQADATDASEVAAAATDCDLVMNLAGLDNITPLSAAAGALRAGCHYVDIGASPTAMRELLGQSAAFAAAGLSCVPSAGTAPGVSGMLGTHAASLLDECDRITINLGVPFLRWGDPAEIHAGLRDGAAVLQTHAAVLAWFVRPAPVVRGGQLAFVRPGDNVVAATAPDGRSYEMMPIHSTEALTVPLAVPRTTGVESRCALWPNEIMEMIAGHPADADLEELTRTVFAELATWEPQRLQPPPDFPEVVFWAQADGRIEGHERSVRCTRNTAFTTAGAVVTAGILAATDPTTPRGVHPSEVCFDVVSFLQRVAETEHTSIDGPPVTVTITDQ
ncbi:MAG: saccharopine dehydrogenase NADP-binding domain-containing protein [Actinobacteria bacterium]|nr:saccharopine dehydrogenase NADP-binding domain-containing protein [Actinomycetota bacterium]